MLDRKALSLLLPWRRKVQKRLEELLPSERLEAVENNIAAIINHLTYVERRMNEKLDAVTKKADEVEAYVVSVVDQVKTALDYLRSHQDAGVKEAAEKIGESLDGIAKKLAELGASGGVV